ncbi:MAG: GWxTD domain-containing protein [Bacteroidales bacterium]|nr:GWxTD domain-containing protein [Bacteroidales bacterium]
MKKIVSLLLILFILLTGSFAQQLKTILDYQVFAMENLQPYLELTVIVRGESPSYVEKEGKLTAEVLINARLQDKHSRKFVDTFSYYLYNTIPSNPNSVRNDFGEIYRKIIDTGEYIVYFNIEDVNDPQRNQEWTDFLTVSFPQDQISVSEINLLTSFAEAEPDDFFEKYGYSLIPKYNDFYPKNIGTFNYFMEIYNTPALFEKNEKVLVKSFIRSTNNQVLNLNHLIHKFEYDPQPVLVILDQFNIQGLPSGNYQLGVEICDPSGKVKTSTYCSFQRSNPQMDSLFNQDNLIVSIENTFVEKMADLGELREHISSIYPVAAPTERKYIRTQSADASLGELQKFFYGFWYKRAPYNPEMAWLDYAEKVKYVNKEFGSPLIKGHRTDRGRIYLQYGPPNSIRAGAYTPTTHPYQIWHYYVIEKELNIRFVFYTNDFVSNDYQLLHSNKIGEIKEPAWQLYLMKGHNTRGDFEQTKPENFFGNDMDFNWNNP